MCLHLYTQVEDQVEGNTEETRHLSTETCPRQIKSSEEKLKTNKNKEEEKQGGNLGPPLIMTKR